MSRIRVIFVATMPVAGGIVGAELGIGGVMFVAGGCGIYAMLISSNDEIPLG